MLGHWLTLDLGDENEQRHLSNLCRKFMSGSFWRAHPKDLNVLTIADRTPRPPSVKAMSDVDPMARNNNNIFAILGFDRKATEQERLARLGKRKREPSPMPSKLELFNPLEGQNGAWQLGESVDDFVRRLPPSTTPIFTRPWVWAANPHRNPRDKSPSPRVEDFTSRGMELLEQSLQTRREIQKEGARRPKSMVTRQLQQESKILQERIASLAKETHVLSGKASSISCPSILLFL